MEKSKIRWTEDTWNPIRGCSRVSEGCRNCYAERVAARYSGPGMPYEGLASFVGPDGDRDARWTGKVQVVEHMMKWPISKERPRLIFVNSMSDLFHESLAFAAVDRIFAAMALSPHHTFQVLTKRPERMRDYLRTPETQAGISLAMARMKIILNEDEPPHKLPWPLPNVWLGVSTEDQRTADQRIPILLETPAAIRWISAEPLIGPLDLHYAAFDGSESFSAMGRLDWVVIGGESGPGARPMAPAWARSLRDQCLAAGVPFFMKQWGGTSGAAKKAAGWLIDGEDWSQYPAGWKR